MPPPRWTPRRRRGLPPARNRSRTCSTFCSRPCPRRSRDNAPKRWRRRTAMSEVTMVEAIRLALARAMADDPRVLILGEDVGKDGGVFRATDGLLARFGPERVLDTPLAEAGIAGVAIGLAAQGFRPVAEIQFMGFAYATLDQMLNHASRLRTRTRGRLTCPMVLR